jgi:hypothetical protein
MDLGPILKATAAAANRKVSAVLSEQQLDKHEIQVIQIKLY